MAGDRTERPTSRRLRDAARRGQLARSKDLTEAAGLLATALVIAWFGAAYIDGLGELLRDGLTRMALAGRPDAVLETGVLTQVMLQGIGAVVLLAGPFAFASAAAAVAASTAQGGWNIATEAIGFHWDRLNPFTGVRKLFGRAGIDSVKMLIVVGVVTWLAWLAVDRALEEAPGFGRIDPMRAAGRGWDVARRLLTQTVIALALLGGADYLVQRWRHERSLRMTKQEVRDDTRLAEGNPEIKARIRRLQRDVIRRRMLSAVPKATVVITNPTEYAVALEYRRDALPAPRVLAKGKGALAARIRAIAREHEVPIVENVPLAQSLYRGVDVGDFIPAELFGAVAEVLAYLIRIQRLAV